MHILIAPNAFKNSLDASKAAEAINKGLRQSKLSCETTLFPVADGGDGTARLLIGHLKAEYIDVNAHDPLLRQISSWFGWIENEKTAIIELAAASGLHMLKPEEYDPVRATTFGTGELMTGALDRNAKKIILCVGGSATVDGGIGILEAMGVQFFDKDKNKVTDLPASMQSLGGIDLTGIDRRILQTEIIILSDVGNPLLGENGAARVFGPQKGASVNQVELLEQRLALFNKFVLITTGQDMSTLKYGGAAGGVAAGLHALLNARLVNGIDYFLALTGFEKELNRADLVITGEGSIDAQTVQGKGPFGVAKMAKAFSLPVIGFAGKLPAAIDQSLQKYFDQLICINEDDKDLNNAILNTYSNLEKAAHKLGDAIAAKG